FELVDQKGGPVNEHMFKDKWSFVFFGYTSCPDICPTTLHVLNTVTEKLAVQDRTLLLDAQVVFISVDPDRDNLDMLAEYMAYFNESFIGITGDKNNIDNITRQFGAGYMMEEETAPGEYLVGHTSAIFLVSPDTKLVAAFSQPHNPGTIVSLYKKVRSYLLK
ncbi:MAG: SCO family protein, partial [Gammaproteobacteria bacterium]|nr:SCO family protein [Gammaproteobacteria bacterium]